MQLKLKKARNFSSHFLDHLNSAVFHPFYSIYYVFKALQRTNNPVMNSQIIHFTLPHLFIKRLPALMIRVLFQNKVLK